MTNEEFEKMKEFIIRQQAQFDIDIKKLKERQDKTSEELDKLTKDVQIVVQATLANTAMIGKLAEAQKISEEKIAKLSDKMAETDDRLNSLIIIFEKHITEVHGGKRPRRSRKRSDQ